MTPRPERNGELVDDVTFSMFGTNRAIRDFTLQVRPRDDSADAERCDAWGSVSYTTESDFRNKTIEDCIEFYFYVKPETFARYIALIGARLTTFFSASVLLMDFIRIGARQFQRIGSRC
jgi:hypothetical protein